MVDMEKIVSEFSLLLDAPGVCVKSPRAEAYTEDEPGITVWLPQELAHLMGGEPTYPKTTDDIPLWEALTGCSWPVNG